VLEFFGPDVDRHRFRVLGPSLTLLGREGATDIAIEDPGISRRHAAFELADGVTTIGDLGSANGLFVNGERVRSRALADGDLIRVGDTLLRYFEAWPYAASELDPRQAPLVGGFALDDVRARLVRAAASPSTVLLLGETGTGKELAARLLHDAGARPGGPFVAVNCAALPAELAEAELFGAAKGAYTGAEAPRTGLVRAADGGTLLLDEIGELSLGAQAKLLRVLELHRVRAVGTTDETPVDFRVVAATNADLERRVADGLFRLDLYGRIARLVVRLPPLREHFEDVPALVQRFLLDVGEGDVEVSPDAMEQLCLRPWPANVRELQAAMERALFEADGARVLGKERFSSIARAGEGGPSEEATPAEAEALLEALRAAEGDVEAAAARLGIGRSQLYRRAKRHGVSVSSFRRG